ncbi:hypothetical protein A4H97_23955 [Niastella yeongjuensis]|uniref:Uncharacterized protein n=1 Tax=Niastella yeongjuensis TaxID=354355 RepID=A0A1V9F2Y2_9BACT|nr:hypothetical protein [Niastella yeongjuensis]OQP52763.1 hypothetical protein A4H97_23955 [Niastella yeongjuensis]SEP19131.1 hypothetical protein SAMN05660816_04678 [Niastella yeongjuensis]
MKEKMDVELSIEVTEDHASARIRFVNTNKENIYFDQHGISYEDIDYGHCFKIIDQDDLKIDYCKIGTPGTLKPEYFITLETYDSLIVNFSLTDIYQFKKGNKHLVQYSTYNRSHLGDEEFKKIESNITEMVIK